MEPRPEPAGQLRRCQDEGCAAGNHRPAGLPLCRHLSSASPTGRNQSGASQTGGNPSSGSPTARPPPRWYRLRRLRTGKCPRSPRSSQPGRHRVPTVRAARAGG
jgi:hypothetical protein